VLSAGADGGISTASGRRCQIGTIGSSSSSSDACRLRFELNPLNVVALYEIASYADSYC